MRLHPIGTLFIGLILGLMIGFSAGLIAWPSAHGCVETPFQTFCEGSGVRK